jgi:hypothetical protein
VADEHDRAVLGVDHPSRGGDVARQGQGRVLDNADPVTVGFEQVIDALPVRSVDEAAVHEYHGGAR